MVRSLTRSVSLQGDEGRLVSYLRESLRGLEGETLDDFLTKNREQHPVEPELNPEGRLICVDDEEFRGVFRDAEGWERFRRTFPDSDGTLRFSRVGLNRSVTQAVLYAGQQFDWSVGSGSYRLLARSGEEWIEVGKVGSWLS